MTTTAAVLVTLPPPAPERRTRTRAAASAAAAMLLVSAALRIPSLDQPLVEAYGFRLTMTAYTARIFHERGISLLHPQVPVLGSPWELPMEFPLYQAVAALLMDAGVPEVTALRGLSLACFTLTGWLLFRLVARVGDEASALAALFFFLFSPLAFLWSRAALMEFAVTAATLGWVLAAWRSADPAAPHRRRWLALAVISGSIAMLVKPTTAAWWAVPVLVGLGVYPHRIRTWWRGGRHLTGARLLSSGLVVLVPFVLAALWTRYADTVKAANPGTRMLTSEALATWNFGTLPQRLDPDAWAQALGHLVLPVTGAAGLVSLCLLVVDRRQVPRLLWVVLATVPLTVLTFWNLYVVHGYYWSAVAPAVAAGIGAGAVLGIRRLPTRWHAPAAGAAAAFWLATTLLPAWTHVALPYTAFPPDHEALGVGGRLAALSEPDDQAFVTGLEWDPSILYVADRRGLMLDDGLPPGTVSGQPDLERYRFAVVLKPAEQSLESTMVRGWAAPRDLNIYEIATRAEDLAGAPVRFASVGPSSATPPGSRPMTCAEAEAAIAAADAPVALHVAADDDARLWFAESLAPAPGRARTVVVDPGALPTGWKLRCQGDASFEVIGAVQ